jgi:hypothetical protein
MGLYGKLIRRTSRKQRKLLRELIKTGNYNAQEWLSCKKKRVYDTVEEANIIIKKLKHENLESYSCSFCGKWHLGHNRKNIMDIGYKNE